MPIAVVLLGFSILWRIVGAADGHLDVACGEVVFQYPLADRRGCGFGALSRRQRSTSFSILWRIVGAAAHLRHRAGAALLAFQYPLADRRGCGNRQDVEHRKHPCFSILWRIVGAAVSVAGMRSPRVSSFSILWRIVGAAAGIAG